MIAINIPWRNCPYPDTASILKSDYSNLMVHVGPTGFPGASHRKTDPSKAIPLNFPCTPTTRCRRSHPALLLNRRLVFGPRAWTSKREKA
jgi:hypothetical protein